jgi:hypothetical protein
VCSCNDGRPDADHKNGVDDWLGSGRTLMQMLTLDEDRKTFTPAVMKRRIDQQERDNALLAYLVEVQVAGRVHASYREMAADLGWSRNGRVRVQRAVDSLEREGVIRRVPSSPDLDDVETLGTSFSTTTTVELRPDLVAPEQLAGFRRLGETLGVSEVVTVRNRRPKLNGRSEV